MEPYTFTAGPGRMKLEMDAAGNPRLTSVEGYVILNAADALARELLRVVAECGRRKGLIAAGLDREERLEARIAEMDGLVERIGSGQGAARIAALEAELTEALQLLALGDDADASLLNGAIQVGQLSKKVEALETENARLRAEVGGVVFPGAPLAGEQDVRRWIGNARAEERVAVLAYLRATADRADIDFLTNTPEGALFMAAEEIERGEHLGEARP